MDQDSDAFRRAKQQAYRYLGYRSRTTWELRDRLRRRGYAADVIDAVLSDLAAQGYVNDCKVASEWARYRLQARPMGRKRLAWELRQRGVEGDLLEEVLRGVYAEFDEASLAEQAARKRLRGIPYPIPPQERQRLARYLAGLGFEPDAVSMVLTLIFSAAASQGLDSSEETAHVSLLPRSARHPGTPGPEDRGGTRLQ